MTSVAHTLASGSVAACHQGTALILQACLGMVGKRCGGHRGHGGDNREVEPLICTGLFILPISTGQRQGVITRQACQTFRFVFFLPKKSAGRLASSPPRLQHIALAPLRLKRAAHFGVAIRPPSSSCHTTCATEPICLLLFRSMGASQGLHLCWLQEHNLHHIPETLPLVE